jgi:hypothetical protein
VRPDLFQPGGARFLVVLIAVGVYLLFKKIGLAGPKD